MSKTIKAGIVFWFRPTDEHEDLFNPEMTQEEILEYCRQLAWEDIISAVSHGYYDQVTAWVEKDNDNENNH